MLWPRTQDKAKTCRAVSMNMEQMPFGYTYSIKQTIFCPFTRASEIILSLFICTCVMLCTSIHVRSVYKVLLCVYRFFCVYEHLLSIYQILYMYRSINVYTLKLYACTYSVCIHNMEVSYFRESNDSLPHGTVSQGHQLVCILHLLLTSLTYTVTLHPLGALLPHTHNPAWGVHTVMYVYTKIVCHDMAPEVSSSN